MKNIEMATLAISMSFIIVLKFVKEVYRLRCFFKFYSFADINCFTQLGKVRSENFRVIRLDLWAMQQDFWQLSSRKIGTLNTGKQEQWDLETICCPRTECNEPIGLWGCKLFQGTLFISPYHYSWWISVELMIHVQFWSVNIAAELYKVSWGLKNISACPFQFIYAKTISSFYVDVNIKRNKHCT